MDDNPQNNVPMDQKRYTRLNKFLLYLLSVELGYYLLLLIVYSAAIISLALASSDYVFYILEELNYWPFIAFLFAIPINLGSGIFSIILNIRIKHKGYPGTGHLLNWIYILSSSWFSNMVTRWGLLHPLCLYDPPLKSDFPLQNPPVIQNQTGLC